MTEEKEPKGLVSYKGRFRGIDRNGDAWSVYESSLATEQCIWIGIDKPTTHHVTGDILASIHLNQAMAAQLIRLLQHFVRYGELPK